MTSSETQKKEKKRLNFQVRSRSSFSIKFKSPGPLQEDLFRSHLVLFGNRLERGIDGTVLEVRDRSERGVSGHNDPIVLAKLDELILLQVRVELDLVDGGLDLGRGEEFLQVVDLEVGDTDRLGDALGDEVFHGFPDVGDLEVLLADLVKEGRVDQVEVDLDASKASTQQTDHGQQFIQRKTAHSRFDAAPVPSSQPSSAPTQEYPPTPGKSCW